MSLIAYSVGRLELGLNGDLQLMRSEARADWVGLWTDARVWNLPTRLSSVLYKDAQKTLAP